MTTVILGSLALFGVSAGVGYVVGRVLEARRANTELERMNQRLRGVLRKAQ